MSVAHGTKYASVSEEQLTKYGPRWQVDVARIRKLADSATCATEVPPVAVCLAATANIVHRDIWSEKLNLMRSFASLAVVSTPSRDVSDITYGLRRSHGGTPGCPLPPSGPHLLEAGEEWRCGTPSGHARRGQENVAQSATLMRDIIVHHTSRRIAALEPEETRLKVSEAWNTEFDGAMVDSELRWAEAEIQMQASCLSVFEAFEARVSDLTNLPFQLGMLVLLRVDQAWLPSMLPPRLMAPSWEYLAACSAPTVLLPDTGDGLGFNDRVLIMNRAAGPAFFRRAWLLEKKTMAERFLSSGEKCFYHAIRSTEELLRYALFVERVRVRRFPTFSATSCCNWRSNCRMRHCFAFCTNTHGVGRPHQDALFSRIPYEGHITALHADAVASGRSRLVVMPRENCPANVVVHDSVFSRLRNLVRASGARLLFGRELGVAEAVRRVGGPKRHAAQTLCTGGSSFSPSPKLLPDNATRHQVHTVCELPAGWAYHMNYPHEYAFCVYPAPKAASYQNSLSTTKIHAANTRKSGSLTSSDFPNVKCRCKFGTITTAFNHSEVGQCDLLDSHKSKGDSHK